METTKEVIKARLMEIEERQKELAQSRREMALDMAVEVGTDELVGINLDSLSKWARRIRKVNTEMKVLADERRWLRESRRRLNPCECDCH
jgi:hypothetical protein